jgi:hypothetical protein
MGLSLQVTELKQLSESDLSFLNEPLKQDVARGQKRSYSVSTGKSFWLFRESILHCRETCISIPAEEYFINEVNFF